MPTDFSPKDGQLRRFNAENGEWEFVDPPSSNWGWLPGFLFFTLCLLSVVWLTSLVIVRTT